MLSIHLKIGIKAQSHGTCPVCCVFVQACVFMCVHVCLYTHNIHVKKKFMKKGSSPGFLDFGTANIAASSSSVVGAAVCIASGTPGLHPLEAENIPLSPHL